MQNYALNVKIMLHVYINTKQLETVLTKTAVNKKEWECDTIIHLVINTHFGVTDIKFKWSPPIIYFCYSNPEFDLFLKRTVK